MNTYPLRLTPEVTDPAQNVLDLTWWGLTTGIAYIGEQPWTWAVGAAVLALAFLPGKRR